MKKSSKNFSYILIFQLIKNNNVKLILEKLFLTKFIGNK